MLILTRLPGEEIVLEPNTIRVRVMGIEPGRVRIGIEAPQSVTIMRSELIGRYSDMKKQVEEEERSKEGTDGRKEA